MRDGNTPVFVLESQISRAVRGRTAGLSDVAGPQRCDMLRNPCGIVYSPFRSSLIGVSQTEIRKKDLKGAAFAQMRPEETRTRSARRCMICDVC